MPSRSRSISRGGHAARRRRSPRCRACRRRSGRAGARELRPLRRSLQASIAPSKSWSCSLRIISTVLLVEVADLLGLAVAVGVERPLDDLDLARVVPRAGRDRHLLLRRRSPSAARDPSGPRARCAGRRAPRGSRRRRPLSVAASSFSICSSSSSWRRSSSSIWFSSTSPRSASFSISRSISSSRSCSSLGSPAAATAAAAAAAAAAPQRDVAGDRGVDEHRARADGRADRSRLRADHRAEHHAVDGALHAIHRGDPGGGAETGRRSPGPDRRSSAAPGSIGALAAGAGSRRRVGGRGASVWRRGAAAEKRAR